MSKIHILEVNNGLAQVVLHSAVPVGDNTAKISWKTATLASGKYGTTVLKEGINKGEISVAEKAEIVACDKIEVVGSIPIESGGATPESIEAMCDAIINAYKNEMQRQLKYFGYTAG